MSKRDVLFLGVDIEAEFEKHLEVMKPKLKLENMSEDERTAFDFGLFTAKRALDFVLSLHNNGKGETFIVNIPDLQTPEEFLKSDLFKIADERHYILPVIAESWNKEESK